MGNSKRLFADSRGLTDHDVAKLAKDGLAAKQASTAMEAMALRDEPSAPITLEGCLADPEPQGIMFEQYAIAAVLMVSFIMPIFQMLH